MTPEEYKNLSIKEFTEAAKVYDSGHAGIYEMCKDLFLSKTKRDAQLIINEPTERNKCFNRRSFN